MYLLYICLLYICLLYICLLYICLLYICLLFIKKSDRLSIKALESNIDYIATVLTAIIFDLPVTEDIKQISKWKNENGFIINRSYLRNYVDFLGHTPRFGPFTFKSKYITKLYDDLFRTCDETKRMKYKPESGFEKFSSTHPVTIEVFLVKPFLFDLLFLILVFSYLFIYFLVLKVKYCFCLF